jgi:hypothetical protein
MIGLMGAYHLIHAGFAGYAAIQLFQMIGALEVGENNATPTEWRELFRGLAIVSIAFGMFGFLNLISSVGFWYFKSWARRLWIALSVLMLLCIGLSVGLWNRDVTEYIIEFLVLALSWWGLLKEPRHMMQKS